MRKSSVKYEQVNEEVMRALADIIRTEVKDPRVPEMTSVLSVDVTPDLSNCNAYISVLGDDEGPCRCSCAHRLRSGCGSCSNTRHGQSH